MRVELMKLQRRLGATFVFVTHDQVEAMTLADSLAVMRNGVLQQMGPPDELYSRPANTFVAGFLGSPKMNLLEGDVDSDAVVLGGVRLRAHVSAGVPGGRVLAGVRPEHLRLDPDGPLRLTVDLVESLGGQKFVYGAAAPGVVLTAGVDPALHPREGETLRFSVAPELVHLFDAQSGGRLN
jgi:ABC-type sugar transport system ATPase subunit